MPISRHDPRFRQMADQIFGSTQCEIVEKEQPSEISHPIDTPKRVGLVCKGGQVIRVPRGQKHLRQKEEQAMPVRISLEDFEQLINRCEKSVQDQFNTLRPPVRNKLARAYEVWKNLPSEVFYAGKIEKELEGLINNADRFVLMLRQVNLLEDAGKGLRGAILFRKKPVDDLDVVKKMVLGSGKMTGWSSKKKPAAQAEEKPAAQEAVFPSEELEESPSEIEETGFDSAGSLPISEQVRIEDEMPGEQSPDQSGDVGEQLEAGTDQPGDRAQDLAKLESMLQAKADSDEFDEMRDEWNVFQRLFPNLSKKDFHKMSFKNRFGEDL